MGRTGRLSRRSAVGAALAAAFFAITALAAASASAAPLVWTANWNGESVSTINSGTGQSFGTSIPVGKRPISMAITPNGRRAVVVNFGGDSATVVETATRTPVKTIVLPDNGERVAISPGGTVAYVTDEGDEEVHVIDPETAKLVGSFPVGPEASAVAFSPDGSRAYVGIAPEEVAVVNTATEKVIGQPIPVGGFPTSIAFTPNGETAYVTATGVKGVKVIDTALSQVVKTIATTEVPTGVAVSPDGKKLYVANATAGGVSVGETASNAIVSKPIPVPAGVEEIAVAPDGKTVWAAGTTGVTPVNLATEKAESVIATGEVSTLVVAPDQSPVAAFAVPDITTGVPAAFSGAASTDADGTIASYSWTFGDGGTATGVSPSHTYVGPGTYNAKLTVVDDEGCGEEEIFTGRTAYCSGGKSSVIHQVTANVAPPVVTRPSNKFRFGRLLHNRKNGTARLQVKLPGAGYILLFGKKVHAVTRKSKAAGSMWLTLHARVEVNKRLKKIHRVPVRIRVTFTPDGGNPKTMHRSVTLLRAPRKKHHQR
jgi:DNA-binding beta-propeller fold protein YncE